MSKSGRHLEDAGPEAVHRCWRQWEALQRSSSASPEAPVSVVDPEGLVLASLCLRDREKRLDDMLVWMAGESELLSVQRMKALARWFPARIDADLRWFAAVARNGDARWKRLSSGAPTDARGRAGKLMGHMSLLPEAAFMLQMRSGLGVGIKADIITCLRGLQGSSHVDAGLTAKTLSGVLVYSVAATRQALDDMVRAGVVVKAGGRPARYRMGNVFISSPRYGAVGEQAPIARWSYSAHVLAFLVACAECDADDAYQRAGPVVRASRLRDIGERFAEPLGWIGQEPFDAASFPGEMYANAFSWTLDAVMNWAAERL